MTSSLMHSYNRLNFKPIAGEGCWVLDKDGKRYLDALGGIAVCALGHANPVISDTICSQAKRLLHISNLYEIESQEELGRELNKRAGMDKAFICNSGAEANEAAIKLARLYASSKAIENPKVVVMENAFHGRTMATLSATGNRKIQAGFEPLVQGFLRAPYNDLEALEQIAINNKNVVAVMLEPIQGESGVRCPDPGYLAGIRKICDDNDWLLILDEIQTGMGRTGKWFAWMHENAKPDVMTVAKALGNGVPIGACLASGLAADLIQPGSHGTTFGGNPLACSVALSVINEIDRLDLVSKAKITGDTLLEAFKASLSNNSAVADIRGQGLMIGIELDRECTALMQAGIDQGILLNVAGGNTIRLLPPYILSDEETDIIVNKICQLINEFTNSSYS